MNVARIYVLVVVYEWVSKSFWSALTVQYLLAFDTCSYLCSEVVSHCVPAMGLTIVPELQRHPGNSAFLVVISFSETKQLQ
jgi:hypothetical protein